MPALNFKAQFADQVRSGEKRQTIRARGKRRPPRVGEPLMLYTGMRQCGCRKLLDAVCTSVEQISISTRDKSVSLQQQMSNGEQWMNPLDADEIEELARADGFANAEAFFAWFLAHHPHGLSGYLIKW